MFGRDKAKPNADAPAPSPETNTPENEVPQSHEHESVLAPNLTVKGNVDFEGAARIEGQVQGNVTGQGRLTVDRSGKVLGDVMAAEVMIQGTVQGNVTAADRLEIAGTAQIAGDVKAMQLVVAQGAKILGRIDIDSESMKLPSNGRSGHAAPKEAAPVAAADALEKVL